MKKYIKPIVVVNDDLTESIYMSSGDPNCYTATATIHQKPQVGRGDFRIQVNGIHDANHTKELQYLFISFNMPVTYKSSNGTLINGDGSDALCIEYRYHQNPKDNIGLGDLVVEADAGLAVTNIRITD